MKPILTIVALLSASAAHFVIAMENIPAFPGAQGAGAFTTGGRGGSAYIVNSLNREGPGSLADAVSQPNRIVVFAVSGVIDLTKGGPDKPEGGKLLIAQPNLTIAGQTAPGEGICLKGGALSIQSGNVILRHLRVRRGVIRQSDSGDAIEIKPVATGVKTKATGQSQEAFQKIVDKKEKRGKQVSTFAPLAGILIDHCSASWATDENMTLTHADRSTAQWSIAAEGLDYANPKQTPPNHSEGSLWGSAESRGVSSLHHMLYAHNRLRNPRTTAGAELPPTLTFWNSVVYDWSEYATHTGSERVLVNLLNNTYRPGPSTPEEVRTRAFVFCGDPQARVYLRGNEIVGAPAATHDNRLAVGYHQKLDKLSAAERLAMIAAEPFGPLPEGLQEAREAYEAVLADGGATLPARDRVDWRIIEQVRAGTGRIIEKETDLPERERALDYRALPAPADADRDGLPDFWERQFGLDPADPADSPRLAAGGYANIEHYINNTDPTGRGDKPMVYISAIGSRASATRGLAGAWRVTRGGDAARPLTVRLTIGGDARPGVDYAPLPSSVTIPAGRPWTEMILHPKPGARAGAVAVLSLAQAQEEYYAGCPAQALVVIE